MALNDVTIIRSDGGLGRKDRTEDMTCGLMITGVAVVGGLQLNTTYKLTSIEDLEDLLVTAAYDITNKTLIHHHVSEFFRMNPSGELYLRVAAQSVKMDELANIANAHAKQLLLDAATADPKGGVRVLGIGICPPTGYTPTLLTGLNKEVIDAIPLAQALADAEFALHRPVDIVLEGRNFNGTSSAALDLRTLNAPNVSVSIPSDPAISGLDALHNGYAAIGTTLGTISKAKVNENIGWVQKFDIQSTPLGRFLTPNLSSNLSVSSYTDASLSQLNTKGYIFARVHTGASGVYFNDSHTCTSATSDFSQIELNRTINKASRVVRRTLLPLLTGPIKIDPSSGKIQSQMAKYYEAVAGKGLKKMQEAGEISGYDVYCDPDQNVLSTSKVKIKVKITPDGVARQIEVEIGFNNPLNN